MRHFTQNTDVGQFWPFNYRVFSIGFLQMCGSLPKCGGVCQMWGSFVSQFAKCGGVLCRSWTNVGEFRVAVGQKWGSFVSELGKSDGVDKSDGVL